MFPRNNPTWFFLKSLSKKEGSFGRSLQLSCIGGKDEAGIPFNFFCDVIFEPLDLGRAGRWNHLVGKLNGEAATGQQRDVG